MAPSKKREKESSAASEKVGNSNKVSAADINSAAAVNGTGAAVVSGGGGVCLDISDKGMSSQAENAKLINQQEQELFFQAFEKPTQIYRFLRNRHGTSPIFLNRTLSYMKDRMSRNNKIRPEFKVNSILDAVTKKSENISQKYINIIYHGIFDKNPNSEMSWHEGDVVCVESTLYKITKSKRKDSTSDFQEILSQSSNTIYNPHEDIGQYAAISIPAESMKLQGEHHNIYKLLFRVKIQSKQGDSETKRNTSSKLYGCELIVFEKSFGSIPDGDYDAALQELNSSSIKSFSPKKRTWETLPENYIPLAMKFDAFNQLPTLKFRLVWTDEPVPASIAVSELSKYGAFEEARKSNGSDLNGNGDAHSINHNNNCIKGGTKTEKIQIVYNFLYSNNTRQQTEYTQEVICPWCGLDCLRLYALLKHLKLCHARFNFTYQPAGNGGARIDVTINDAYDGSYAGSPHDLAGPSGSNFARTCGPVRRTTVTNLLVCRPRRQKTCLDEFLVLDEDDLNNQRPYITGHNRLYHHTETYLPVHPKELDIDSEGESDPLWLRQKTIQMIDEFSDVNEGEKEFMKLWNLHVMKHGYVGDCQLPLACEMFLAKNGHEIIQKNLYRNFILHMCSLFDYGLVSADTIYKTVQMLQGIISKYPEGLSAMSAHREVQLNYWLEVGIHKQDEQKLKSPLKLPTNAMSSLTSDKSSEPLATAENASSKPKAMNPPPTRSGAAVKRSGSLGTMPSSGDKSTNGSGKSVAKKSALPDDDAKVPSGRRNSSASLAADRDAKSSSRLSLDSKTSTLKRRLSMKETLQPATKRSRTSDTQSNSTSANSSTTRSATIKDNTSNNNNNHTSISKRLVARRQSVAGTGILENSSVNDDIIRLRRQQQHIIDSDDDEDDNDANSPATSTMGIPLAAVQPIKKLNGVRSEQDAAVVQGAIPNSSNMNSRSSRARSGDYNTIPSSNATSNLPHSSSNNGFSSEHIHRRRTLLAATTAFADNYSSHSNSRLSNSDDLLDSSTSSCNELPASATNGFNNIPALESTPPKRRKLSIAEYINKRVPNGFNSGEDAPDEENNNEANNNNHICPPNCQLTNYSHSSNCNGNESEREERASTSTAAAAAVGSSARLHSHSSLQYTPDSGISVATLTPGAQTEEDPDTPRYGVNGGGNVRHILQHPNSQTAVHVFQQKVARVRRNYRKKFADDSDSD